MKTPDIVIVEDNKDCQFLLGEFMNLFGYTTLSFNNAEEAIPYCQTQLCQPKVFLIDISLPGLNGIEFLEIIKDYPNIKNSKKIAATVMAFDDDIELLKHKGFDDIFTKPINFTKIEKQLKVHFKEFSMTT